MRISISEDVTSTRTPMLTAKKLEKNMRMMAKENALELEETDQSSVLKQINSNGIVSPLRLIIIACLIFVSFSTIQATTDAHWKHVKGLLFYFNYYVFENVDLGIYDNDDNIDQCAQQIIMFDEMTDHFDSLIGYAQNFTISGFPQFSTNSQNGKTQQKNLHQSYENETQMQVILSRFLHSGELEKKQLIFQDFKNYFKNLELRDYLLQSRIIKLQIGFGDNKKISDFWIIYDYKIYSQLMVSVKLSVKYQPDINTSQMRRAIAYRIIQQLLSLILVISYFTEARKLYYDESLQKQFRKNSLYWCLSLIFLSFVAFVSDTLSPLCCTLQLLPVFQNHDSSNTLTFNFNVNLRYAMPIVFGVIVPVYIVMNGYILFSMIMYPGDYFDDYLTGFFSYFYNIFQYGTYQIYTELKDKGDVAYFLYTILYFYMVLVGTNLLPALFCTLIYRRINQRELVRYIQTKVQFLICPKCHHHNFEQSRTNFSVQIQSPKAPYLQAGTKLMKKQKPGYSPITSPHKSPITTPLLPRIPSRTIQKNRLLNPNFDSSKQIKLNKEDAQYPLQSQEFITKMYIQDELQNEISHIQYIKNKNKKVKEVSNNFNHLIQSTVTAFNQTENKEEYRAKICEEWLVERMKKIEKTLQTFQKS